MFGCRLGCGYVWGRTISNGRLEGVVEEVGRQLSPWSLRSLVNTFQRSRNRFDLLFASLSP